MHTSDKLSLLRQQMALHQIDAYIVPSTDPHQSEYLSAHWKSREWLSGFTGSAGTLIVRAQDAGLWTDARYFLQAEQELAGSGITLQRQLIPHAPEHIIWLCDHLPAGARIGLDGRLYAMNQVRHLEKQLNQRGILLQYDLDLIEPIWNNRPPLPDAPIYEHDTYFSGIGRTEKIQLTKQALPNPEQDGLLCCTLDDIAWILNLRGSDIDCTPLFMAFLLLTPSHTTLYTDLEKLPQTLRIRLQQDHVLVRPYNAIEADLACLPTPIRIALDPAGTSIHLYTRINSTNVLEFPNPIPGLKAIKNPTEIYHIRQAMRKDGVALTRLFRWLESALQEQQEITEVDIAHQIATFRSMQENYIGESFPAIVGYRENGAIIHYHPEPESAAYIHSEGLLLIDCGGQYLDGTTDITRTITLSTPTIVQKHHYTLVLKGHIALANCHFPKGTIGMQLDTLARMPLWKAGLNYAHGTGHGVGFFLCVHEGPNGFASNPTTTRGNTPFSAGMLTSNEPGYYLTGEYGIRIENLLICAETASDKNYLCFETVSLFPIDTQLIEKSLLDIADILWLNDYHKKVFEELAPLLNPEEAAWLRTKCLPL